MAEITKKQILDKEDNPQALEDLYRSDPVKFKVSLLSAAAQNPASKLFEFWRVRIEYEDPALPFSVVPIAAVMLIAAFFGLLVRIPETFLTETWYYPRFGPFFTLLSVATYFLYKNL